MLFLTPYTHVRHFYPTIGIKCTLPVTYVWQPTQATPAHTHYTHQFNSATRSSGEEGRELSQTYRADMGSITGFLLLLLSFFKYYITITCYFQNKININILT